MLRRGKDGQRNVARMVDLIMCYRFFNASARHGLVCFSVFNAYMS